jgi:hypothetical protein
MKIMNNVEAIDYHLTLFYISLKIYSWQRDRLVSERTLGQQITCLFFAL